MPQSSEGPFRSPDGEQVHTADTPPTNSASTSRSGPVPDPDPATPTDEFDDELPIATWKLVTAVAALIVVVAIIGLVVFVAFGDDEGGEAADAVQGAIVDGFDRTDDGRSLGATDTGQVWEVISGTWGIKDQQAALITPNPDGPRSVAVIDMGAPNGSIQVTGSAITNGWGLVFRYRSQYNYWYITGSRDTASYQVVKTSNTDGELKTETVRQINLANTKDGAVVQVVLRASTIEIYVDGKLRDQFLDDHNVNAPKVGMIAVGEAPVDARWDNFTATPDLTVAANPGFGGGTATTNGTGAAQATVNVPAPPASGSAPPDATTTAPAPGGD